VQSGLLLMATFGLIIPAAFDFSTSSEREISLEIAIILFLVYLSSIAFTLMVGKPDDETNTNTLPDQSQANDQADAGWSRNQALGILAAVTIALAVMSEIMTDSLDPAAKSMGFTPLFAGVFLLALVGNTAELINSVRFARQNKMDLALGITVGGSTQMALLVAPLLVFFGLAIGQNMNLLFSQFELIAVILTTYATLTLLQNGFVYWGAGVFLIALYLMLGVGFYYAPSVAG